MSALSSIWDVLLVSWFEVRRAVRTWRALAMMLLYAIAAGGASYLFVQFIGALEKTTAETLGVAHTETPGALVNEVIKTDQFRGVLAEMVGSEQILDELLAFPLLAIFNLWIGLIMVPFFATTASAECISIDLQTRGIRFEALRTGRLELVLGRFGGQLLLTAAASAVSIGAVWMVGMVYMTGNPPLLLASSLGWLTLRAWCFGVPFVGFGVACSQLTTSPAWARVLAVSGTAGSWVLYGIARGIEERGEVSEWVLVGVDVLLQVLPQAYIGQLWSVGTGWIPAAVALAAIGMVLIAGGFVRFSSRDL